MRLLTPVVAINLGDRVQVTKNIDCSRQNFEMKPGHFNLVTAGTEQQASWHDPMNLCVLYVDESYLHRIVEEALESKQTFKLLGRANAFDPTLLSLAVRLVEEVKQPSPLAVLKGQSLIDLFLVQLAEAHSTLRKSATEYGVLSRRSLTDVVEYIESNLNQNLSLQEIAEVANLSSFHFLRQFKRTFLVTPHYYVLHRRVERAKLLLQNEAISIQDVATMVGFVDPGHFSKAFKQRTGLSPSQYRRQYR